MHRDDLNVRRFLSIQTISPLVLALILAAVPGFPPLFADEPSQHFEDRVEVTEVLLDVLVADKRGNVIVGLDKDDFLVEENGEAVEVEQVTFYSNLRLAADAVAPSEGGEVDETPQERYFILFFHNQRAAAAQLRGLLGRQLEAARVSQRWVQEELMPRDFVAVVSYDYKLKVHEDFTQDRGALLEAIQRASRGKDSGNWPSRLDESAPLSLRARLPQGKALRDATKTIYDGLGELAKAAGRVQGRKNVMMFSIGFGEVDSFGQYRRDRRYYDPMTEALNDNNVAVYSIDLSPIGTRHVMENAMNEIAADTGGEYLRNFTSFLTPLQRVSERNGGYYLLSYRGTHPVGEAGFQTVEVKTRNPEFKVRARSGYLYGE